MGLIKKPALILTALIALTMLCASAMAVDVEIASDPALTTVGEIAYIYVRVLDNSTPQNNTLVNFTTTSGNLSAASAYTNSSGIAVVWINSTTAGNATINASVGSVFNTTNVTYIAGRPASIDINVTQNQLVVANTTIINLTAYDKYNNVNTTVNLTLNITISDIPGEIEHHINISRAPYTLTRLVANQSNVTLENSTSNISSVLLHINSTIAGNITLIANAENITSSANITFIPGAAHRITALYSNECTVNETSQITVLVQDIYDNPVKDAVVIFNATPPPDTKYNSPIEYNSLNLTPEINITNQIGRTSTLFLADKRAGDNIINISVGGINLSITIRGIADQPVEIHLTHTPDTVYANNIDTYSLTAQVVDQFLNCQVVQESGPLTKQIVFNTSLGTTSVPLNETGSATTLIGPTPHVQSITVTATYKNETGLTDITNTTNLSFILGSLNRFIIYTNPDTVLISNLTGNHNSSISIIAMDAWGHPISGINVTLNNTDTILGNLTVDGINSTNLINATTDSDGRISAVFTSNTTTGNATITARNGSISASTIVEIKDQPFISTFISIEPLSIDSGDIVNVTTILSVEGELPVTRTAASTMLVLDRSGSMDPDYYAGTPLDVMLVNDVSGSMDPDYYNAFWGYESIVEKGFTPYDYQTNGSVLASSWWIDNFVLNESVNDLKIVVSDNNLKLQLISPDGKVYGYDGWGNNSPSYMWSDNMQSLYPLYWDTAFHEWLWHKPYSYPGSGSYSYSADADFPEQGTWTVRVYNPTASSSSFSISSYIEKLSAVRTASKNFNENLVSNDRIGLVSFGGVGTTATERISVSPLTHDIDNIKAAIDDMYASGGTPTGDAIKNAKDQLVNQQRSGARPYIILLSDGQPTVGSGTVDGVDYSDPVDYALAQAEAAKNTIINGYQIKIYTIGIGVDVDADFMKAAASSRSDYYYAASASQLKEIYYSIAQQVSDFDIRTREYGINGFTPYLHAFSGTGNHSININETINDLKVEIDNPDLNLTLISPSGVIYPDPAKTGYNNKTGIYISETGKYIWISPISGEYPQTDMDYIEQGNWTINVTGSGNVNISTYIDKKSAVKLASHAFISSFDASRGDRAGLVLYSDDSVNNSNIQTSYLRNGSTWVGYFEGSTPQKSYTLNFTGKDLDTSYNGYGECYITMNGEYLTSMPPPNVADGAVENYTVDITAFTQSGSNNISFYDYHDIYSSNWWNEIKDVKIFENGNLIASYQSDWVDLTANPNTYSFNASFNVTTFNLTWENTTDNLDLYLFRGTTLVNYSNGTSGFEELSEPIYSGYNYHVVVDGVNITSETKFNLTASQNLDWKQWSGTVASSLENSSSSFDFLNNSIDTMTADGLTAIDEGLYEANNELSSVSGNSTMVLMTDGLDNAGYHSMLLEAQRAKNNHTVIYTVGFGINESEIDPVLLEIANVTGGEYYFAPNASVLKSIFHGIAANITNFTADAPMLNLHIPYNYISNLSVATATYVVNSSNATTGNATNFTAPTYPNTSNAEPNMTTVGNETTLSWDLPNLNPGDRWGVWFQLKVQGAGYVPLILSSSNIGFIDVNGTNITQYINYGGGSNIGGTGVNVSYLALGTMQLSANPSIVLVGSPSSIVVTMKYVDGNPAIADVKLFTDFGYFDNNIQNEYNMTVSGEGTVDFASAQAGYANINAYGTNGNNTLWESVVVVVRPKGKITIS